MKRFWIGLGTWLLALTTPAVSQTHFHITEISADNQSGLTDEHGNVNDWIEIHNRAPEPQSLAGWSLTDAPLTKQTAAPARPDDDAADSDRVDLLSQTDTDAASVWEFPDVRLEADQYLIVFASGRNQKDARQPLHTDFKLNAKGEYLALLNPAGEVVDSFSPGYPKQKKDISFGDVDSKNGTTTRDVLAFPTPGRKNSEARAGKLSTIELSQPHGLFKEGFSLSINAAEPGVTVRYTTDGGRPHESSPVFSGPTEIDRTTVIRARGYKPGYAPTPIVTRSYIFPADRLDDCLDGLPPADYPYKWWVGNANYGMDPALTQDPKYRAQVLDALYALPSYSLVTEMENLFSSESGIYAHSGWHGRRAERPCSLELLPAESNERESGFQIDCGVRMRGGASRTPQVVKHGFRLFFRSQYGFSQLKYDLFHGAGAKTFDHIDLRCSQNYAWHHGFSSRSLYVRDQFNRDTQLEMGHPGARGDFRHVYVNGHYWGIFNTCERPKAAFGESYLGGKKQNFDVVKVMGGFSEGDERRTYEVFPTDGNMDAWARLDQLTQQDMSQLENYCRTIGVRPDGSRDPAGRRLLDAVNLVDYMLIIFYGGNLDAPISWFGDNRGGNNWYGLINRKRNEGFRFMIWDAEHSLLELNEDRLGPFPLGNTADRSNPHWLYQRLLENEEFRMLVADRIAKHMFRDGALTPQPSIARMNRRLDEIRPALIAEAARWGTHHKTYRASLNEGPDRKLGPHETSIAKYEEWFREVDRTVNDYLPKRTDVVLDQLFSRGLYPDLPEIQATWSSAGDDQQTLSLQAGDLKIYYTTNNQDPRLFGGELNMDAWQYDQPMTVGKTTQVLCRIYDGKEWGPLREIRPSTGR